MKRPLRRPIDENSRNNGSPKPGGPLFLTVGKILRPHGVRGEVLMTVLTDFPERLIPGKQVFAGDTHQPLVIQAARQHQKSLLVSFAGLQDRDSVERLVNSLVYVDSQDLPPLAEGEYYHHQLLGLQVKDSGGGLLGILREILQTGANDVYIVVDETGREILLPALEDVVLEVNLETHTMLVKPPDWYNA